MAHHGNKNEPLNDTQRAYLQAWEHAIHTTNGGRNRPESMADARLINARENMLDEAWKRSPSYRTRITGEDLR